MNAIWRSEIINLIVNKYGFQSYLEIGVRRKADTYNKINCQDKMSVDKNPDFAPTFLMTSDEFFFHLDNNDIPKRKWDVIFIDACHRIDFVSRDVFNALRYLSENGVLVLHDILPVKIEFAIENDQNGSAWKIVPYILKNFPHLHVCSVTEIHGGCGIVVKRPTVKRKLLEQNFNPFYDFLPMDADRKKSQNWIDFEQLNEWLDNPFYL